MNKSTGTANQGLWESLRQSWQELADGRPGHRFGDFYRQRRRAEQSNLKKFFSMFAGSILLAAGLLMLAAPGPGILFMALGAAMLAQYSLWVANLLDRAERKFRSARR